MAKKKTPAAKTVAAKAVKEAGLSGKLKVEYRPIAGLIPYARNARTHSETQIAEIAGSIQEFGFNDPIAVDGHNGVIEGYGRILAARKLGMTELPVIELAHLTETQKRAYILAHNRIALNAGWDNDLLKVELAEIEVAGIDLASLGFNEREIARALGARQGATDENEIPDAPSEPVARRGDVWKLGDHILVCGDCTVASDVEKCLGKIKPHLMVTDPPYGVNYDPGWRARAGVNMAKQGADDDRGAAAGLVRNDDRADWREAWALFPGDVAYVWHGGLHGQTVAESLVACDFAIRAQIIWNKSSLLIGRGDYHWKHEPCFYAVRKGKVGHWSGDRTQATVWDIEKPRKSETGHGTQKPVECMRRPIENNSSAGQAVYEPFNGSGTTLIACEQTGRICHAIEIEPAYVDVTILRWQNFTEQNAVLLSTGQSFTEVMGDRTPDKVIHGKPKDKKATKERDAA